MARPTKLTDEMYARIPALRIEGKSREQIAEMFGTTPGSLSVQCSKRGVSLRKNGPLRVRIKLPDEPQPLPLETDVMKSLRDTARMLGKVSTTRLVSDLLAAIARDNLYEAVLDEEAA